MCLEIHQLDLAKCLSGPGLAWQAALKKTELKLELLTDIDMLLTVQKGIKGEIYHSINRYVKAYNKYVQDYDKNKESSCLKYWYVNNVYGWEMSQKMPVNDFKKKFRLKKFLNFMKVLKKVIMRKVMKDIFLKLIFST